MSKWQEQKREVLEAARLMAQKGLVVGSSGNVSIRLPHEDGKEIIAITPCRRYYDELSIEDIPVIDFETEPVEGDLIPSSETMLHIAIYQARKNVNAVIHSHSIFASALAVAGLEIPPILDDQVTFIGAEIKLANYAVSGSVELVENAIAALGENSAVLLPNHGAIGVGKTMRDAFTACELLEKTAKIYLAALAAGKVNRLPDEAVEVLHAYYSLLQSGEH